MSAQRYPEEFRVEVVKQILEHGHTVADVSRRLSVSTHSLYKWMRLQQISAAQRQEQISQSEELLRIKAGFKRKSGGVLRSSARLRYTLIAKHQSICSVKTKAANLRATSGNDS